MTLFINKLLCWIICKAINYLPLKNKWMFIKEVIVKNRLVNDAISLYYFNGNLNERRFGADDILSAVNKAICRFSNVAIYYLTDEYVDFNTKNITKISIDMIKSICKNDDELPKIFVCAYESDEKLLMALNEIIKFNNTYYYTPSKYFPTARYFHRNDIARSILNSEMNINLPKFEVADFENIIQALDITRNVKGDYVEIGVYQGRSAHLALNYMKEKQICRKSYFIDIFEGFTYEAAENSADALWVNSHTDTSCESVKKMLGEFEDVQVLKLNVLVDKLPNAIELIAVCNIDVDMYEAVFSSLNSVGPLMSVAGIIIVEDQGHTPALAGGYFALCEFLKSETGRKFIPVHMASGQMYLIRHLV